MNTKTTLVITGLIAAVVIGASTIIPKPVYAPGNCASCASPFAPGHLKTFVDPVPATPLAPGQEEGPANQFAPGQVAP